MRIFVAGATGAIGRPLIAELLRHGHQVTGISRSAAGAARLQALGAAAVVTDALHPAALEAALRAARPDAVIDQLTALPADLADYPAHFPGDSRLRLEGGGHLHRLARELGVARYLQQSSGFFLAPGPGLAGESVPLTTAASPGINASAAMYAQIEQRLQGSAPMQTVALRYGFFYGPGTWYWSDGAAARHLRNGRMPVVGSGSGVWSFVHVEDAAQATVAALTAPPGVYNIVDDDPSPAAVWLPAFARWLQAAPPPRVTAEQALAAAGPDAVHYGLGLRGAANAKARAHLGFHPRPLVWLAA